jgi:hypothetical protein
MDHSKSKLAYKVKLFDIKILFRPEFPNTDKNEKETKEKIDSPKGKFNPACFSDKEKHFETLPYYGGGIRSGTDFCMVAYFPQRTLRLFVVDQFLNYGEDSWGYDDFYGEDDKQLDLMNNQIKKGNVDGYYNTLIESISLHCPKSVLDEKFQCLKYIIASHDSDNYINPIKKEYSNCLNKKYQLDIKDFYCVEPYTIAEVVECSKLEDCPYYKKYE